MSEENLKHIPTLEDVVEIGEQTTDEQESIRIVADNDVVDDEFGDEFNELFENNTEQQAVELKIDSEEVYELTDDLWDDVSVAPAEDDEQAMEPETPVTDDILLTADKGTVSIDEAAEDKDLWIQDWQEASHDSSVIEDGVNVEISAEIDDADIDPDTAIVTDDDIKDAIIEEESSPQPVVADVAQQAPQTSIDTSELVNQIVGELMPELEWKLRTRIREILEQHFPPEE